MKYRKERIGELLKEIISKEIAKSPDFDGGLITIMEVLVEDKLDKARVIVQVYPDEIKYAALVRLNRKAKEFEYLILKSTFLKKSPHLVFE